MQRESTILLIRHGEVEGAHDVLWGRSPGVRLSTTGRKQVQALASRLSRVPLRLVVSSPRPRTMDTARAIAAPHRARLHRDVGFDEFDFGDWSGATFEALDADPRWHRFNDARSTAGAPDGETTPAFRVRVAMALRRLVRRRLPVVAVVTHAEVIRTLVLESLGLTPDDWAQVPIDTATVTMLAGSHPPLRVVAFNLGSDELDPMIGLARRRPAMGRPQVR